jgi:hypothetical protein
MSVHDILKKYGKWIQESEFEKLIAFKMHISDRQAYRKIKKAYDVKAIIKIPLPNRTVLYGLQEFGPSYDSSLDYSRLTEEQKEELGHEYERLSQWYAYQAFVLLELPTYQKAKTVTI